MPNAPYAIVEAPPTLGLATASVVAQGDGGVMVIPRGEGTGGVSFTDERK